MPILRSRQRGFTLIEALVAFAVLALILGLAFTTFSNGLNRVTIAEGSSQATARAEAILARVGADIPIEEGDQEIPLDEPYRAMVSMAERARSQPPAVPLRVIPFDVAVTVSWKEGNSERQTTLHSVRLATANETELNR